MYDSVWRLAAVAGPEDTKNEFRHAMKLVGEGVPAHEAMREAQVYIEQRRRIRGL